jgi:hypothetical protein
VSPGGPDGPDGPVSPCGPDGPLSPCAPEGPLAPLGPDGPDAFQETKYSVRWQALESLTKRSAPVVLCAHAWKMLSVTAER